MNMRGRVIVGVDDDTQPLRAQDRGHPYTNAISGASSAFMPITL